MKSKRLLPLICCLLAGLLHPGSVEAWPTEKPVAKEPRSSHEIESAHAAFSSSHTDLRKIQRQYNDDIKPMLMAHCSDCHWGPDAEADFNLEGFQTLDQLLDGRKKWKKVVVRVAAKEMPPEDEMPESEHRAVLEWIDNLLNSVDCTEIDPGRVTIRRLNRTEYKNTIRDLAGVEYDPAKDFPGDDVGYGFDNIADVLSLPPILMEKYLQAAEEITNIAVVDPDNPAFTQSIEGAKFDKTRGSRPYDSFHVLATNGTIKYEIQVPETGKYDVSVRAFADQAGDKPAKMSVSARGKTIGTKSVREESDEHGTFQFVARLRKGKNKLEIGFLNDYYEKSAGDRNLHIASVAVKGPLDRVPESHKLLIPNSPPDAKQQRIEARKALNVFMSRAYRRRASPGELSRLMKLYDQSREQGDGFEVSLRFAFQAVLVSPHFLYKIETPTQPGQTRDLRDFELATNLSYFLWSTMPDPELLRLASQNQLRRPEVYRQQVKRMLQDPKSSALVENFVAQWLQLRHLEHFKPDPDLFPDVDVAMRHDMATETKMVFADLIKRDASILDVLETEYSFLNQRLAEHYGINNVKGDRFRRVSMRDHGRVGLMTQASILTLTSNPTRTSPVKRGKWIMENLLGDEPPPPDPDAMQLEDQSELTGTLRQRMEQHRANPACAVCHKVMDQLGFALENYDAVGQWREFEETNTIDASGELPDGTAFQGALELQQTVKTKMQDQFIRCTTEKMLIYALGRGLEYFDECTIDKIIRQLEPNDYRFSDLIMAVATSDPFLKRRGIPVDDEQP